LPRRETQLEQAQPLELDGVLQRDEDEEGERERETERIKSEWDYQIITGLLRYTSTDLPASLAYVSARLLVDLRARG